MEDRIPWKRAAGLCRLQAADVKFIRATAFDVGGDPCFGTQDRRRVDSKKVEHECRMISSFGLGFEGGQVPTFWLLFIGRHRHIEYSSFSSSGLHVKRFGSI